MVTQWNLYNQDIIGGQYKFRSFESCPLAVILCMGNTLQGFIQDFLSGGGDF